MIKVESPINPRGVLWDYEGKSEIVQIFISHCPGSQTVCSIQFVYVENGVTELSQKHGDSIGGIFTAVKLDYPSEFITWISSRRNLSRMISLTIGTNKGIYGPFGCPNSEQNFEIQLGEDNVFGGFHGSISKNNGSKYCIESIGVYVKQITSLSNLNTTSKIKKEKF